MSRSINRKNHKTVLLATDTRTGSNYLCALMKSTGLLGNPHEYFSPHITFGNPFSIKDRCETALKLGTTANDVTSIKIFAHHMDLLNRKIRLSDYFENRYWVWLRRKDLLAQAVSRSKAIQTGSWDSTVAENIIPVYSSKRINNALKYISTADARWRIYFARNNITPFAIWYEDFIDSPVETIMQIGRFSEIEIRAESVNTEVHTKIQRTPINEGWEKKFISETADINYLDNLKPSRSYQRTLRNFLRFLCGRLPAPF